MKDIAGSYDDKQDLLMGWSGIFVSALYHILPSQNVDRFRLRRIKDGAYYCYCAYVLRISRYSDFLSPMLTNTGIFLRGLKLSGKKKDLSKYSWYPKRKLGVTMDF